MIKLKREQDEALGSFNKWIISASVTAKTCMIELLFENGGMLAETFNTDELKLKATQAILDGEWEVEEQLYYVKLIDSEIGYLNHNVKFNIYFLGNRKQSLGFKFKFTRAEVEAIDPRYLEFLEEVE